MFKLLNAFRRRNPAAVQQARRAADQAAPQDVIVNGSSFALSRHISHQEGFPMLDWDAAWLWASGQQTELLQRDAWAAVERASLLHMRDALGPGFNLDESVHAMVVSSLPHHAANATLDYMERTLRRVVQVLDGLAIVPPLGKDILIVFDDSDSYYRYVSHCYPDDGEFALSSGMHIHSGCSHYVTIKDDLRVIEPIIAHEMTHGCLGHLPLPTWLNEGLAVNVEQRLAPTPATHTPQELRAMHQAYWEEDDLQAFWSGQSFMRTDDGNLLSYALARLLVEQMSRDWPRFKAFVLAADAADAGGAAARQHLGVELGAFVCALLERTPSPAWEPTPGALERRGLAV